MRTRAFALIAGMLLAADGSAADKTPERDAKWIRERVAQIKQSEPTAWQTIPWAATILDARRQSEQEKRPVFLFTHDGNLETGRC